MSRHRNGRVRTGADPKLGRRMKKKRLNKNRSKKPADPAILLVSYVPLLRGKAGASYDLREDRKSVQAITAMVGKAPTGHAECCLWMLDDQNRPGAVLALDQAAAIAQHLKEWAENQPEKWFKVYMKEKDGKYAVVLFPELRQSLSRFKFAYLLEGGDPITAGQVQIIVSPLHFVSGAGTAYSAIKDRIGKTISVGLVDPGMVDWQNPFSLDPAKITNLGEFEVGNNQSGWLDAYLDGLIAGATKPPRYASRTNPQARDKLGGLS
jgi:hypothetical protein